MLRRISVLLLSVLVMLALVGSVALAEQPARGVPGADEDKETGTQENPDAWGGVTSNTAIKSEGAFGGHASDPTDGDDQPRLGIGNVALNDEEQAADLADADLAGTNPDGDGTHVSDHGCVVDTAFGTSCLDDPGTTAREPA